MTGKQPIVIGKGQEFCLDGSEDIIIGTAGKICTADGFNKNRIPDKHNAVANDAHTAELQNRRPADQKSYPGLSNTTGCCSKREA